MNKKILLSLLFIIVLAFGLRFYNVTKVPPSPDWDEASLGYNAYSLLKTGKDEYGSFLPIALRSFNDYKPALYVYLIIPFIKVFDLSLLAVRLPSVFLGTLTVFIFFFLARELFWQMDKWKEKANEIGLVSSFLLAVSPWHIQFSRVAFEANAGLSLVVFGLAAFFIGLRKQKMWWYCLSALLLSLSLYAYHAQRIFVPLLLLVIFVIYRTELLKKGKALLVPIVIGIAISLPIILLLFIAPAGRERLQNVSVYSDQTGLLASEVGRQILDQNMGNKLGAIFHNRRITYVNVFLENYLWHFSPRWLFLSGDSTERHHAPDMGVVYLTLLPAILLGIYYLVSGKEKVKYFILAWVLLAPLPAAPTVPVPHSIRSFLLAPVLQIVAALGILTVWDYFLKKRYGIILLSVICFLFTANVFYYLDMYFSQMPKEFAPFWQYGYKQAIAKSVALAPKYKKIVFSGKLEQPYIFYLFYTKYDPVKYQKDGGSLSIDFNNWSYQTIGKYEFKLLDWGKEEKSPDILYVGRPQDFSGGVKIIDTIYYPDKTPAMLLVEG